MTFVYTGERPYFDLILGLAVGTNFDFLENELPTSASEVALGFALRVCDHEDVRNYSACLGFEPGKDTYRTFTRDQQAAFEKNSKEYALLRKEFKKVSRTFWSNYDSRGQHLQSFEAKVRRDLTGSTRVLPFHAALRLSVSTVQQNP